LSFSAVQAWVVQSGQNLREPNSASIAAVPMAG
jgi:hypothetical protein